MTPAEELTAAADKLDRCSGGATPGPWKANGFSVWSTAEERLVVGNSGAFTKDARFIATMNPLVGKVLVDLLRAHAEVAATLEDMLPPNENEPTGHIWHLAKLINGSDH